MMKKKQVGTLRDEVVETHPGTNNLYSMHSKCRLDRHRQLFVESQAILSLVILYGFVLISPTISEKHASIP